MTSAREVLDRGEPDLVRAVDHGEIAVSLAAGLARQGRETQLEAARNPARAPHIVKLKLRAAHEAALAQRQLALPSSRYGVLYPDCPWGWQAWSDETGLDAAPQNHYATPPLDEIMALPVASIAADDAVLLLWGTAPMLPQALEVMAAWSFTYKSHVVWVKTSADGGLHVATGYWFRNRHELLLVGTRGNPPAPAPGTQWPSVIEAPVGRHSQKPEVFYRLIESYYPSLRKLEMFARGAARPGWQIWGAEAEGA